MFRGVATLVTLVRQVNEGEMDGAKCEAYLLMAHKQHLVHLRYHGGVP